MGGMVMVYGKEVPVAQVGSRKQTPVAIAREETYILNRLGTVCPNSNLYPWGDHKCYRYH